MKKGKKTRKARKKGRRASKARSSCPVVHTSKNLGQWIRRENKLGGPGYTGRSERSRHHYLRCSLERFGYRSTLGSLQVLLRNRSMGAKARKVVERDLEWLKEHVS